LHELAHAYHDQFAGGFGQSDLVDAHRRARESKKYNSVLRIDGKRGRHYALTNPQEFFAEASEAYWGVNDFYPFVRVELAEFDPETHRLIGELWGEPPAPSPTFGAKDLSAEPKSATPESKSAPEPKSAAEPKSAPAAEPKSPAPDAKPSTPEAKSASPDAVAP